MFVGSPPVNHERTATHPQHQPDRTLIDQRRKSCASRCGRATANRRFTVEEFGWLCRSGLLEELRLCGAGIAEQQHVDVAADPMLLPDVFRLHRERLLVRPHE